MGFRGLDWNVGLQLPGVEGKFYPADLRAAKMLPYYAARFSTVEINYTFYRLPNEKMVGAWAAATPDAFRLTLKAPKRITHDRRLKDCASLVQAFCSVAATLGPKLGVLLFQLGPTFRKDLAVFDAFLLESAARALARRSSSATRRGSATRCTSGSGRATWRCVSPIPRSWAPRSSRPRTTATSDCGTKATRRRRSPSGPA